MLQRCNIAILQFCNFAILQFCIVAMLHLAATVLRGIQHFGSLIAILNNCNCIHLSMVLLYGGGSGGGGGLNC